MVADVRKTTSLSLDCHLMIVHPEKYVKDFAKAGADYITVHYEACGENLKDTLLQIRENNVKCGLVINPDTSVEKVENLIPLCDMVLVMSVFPGFGGQKFIRTAAEKIKTIRRMLDERGLTDVEIEVDGGVNPETAKICREFGANVLVAGNAVYSASDPAAMIKTLRGQN